MAVYEALLLNTVVPQIQAAQAGDSYVMVVNATTPALRITQTGTGDSILVEDSSNPDSSPFVVTAAGDVGIGTSSPFSKLTVSRGGSAGAVSNFTDGIAQGLVLTTGTGYFGFYNPNYGAIKFRDGGNAFDLMTLDASGNLGLGVTPSAWGAIFKTLDISGGAVSATTGGALVESGNAYFNGTNWIYKVSESATRVELNAGAAGAAWYIAPSGTANTTTITNGVSYTIITSGNQTAFGAANNNVGTSFTATSSGTLSSGTVSQNISFTQAMTLDASGNLGVGTTSPLSVAGYTFVDLLGSTGAQYRVRTSTVDLRIGASATDAFVSSTNSALWFGTNNTERARITSGGFFKASPDATYLGSTSPYHEFLSDDNNANYVLQVRAKAATASNAFGIRISYTTTPNSTGAAFWACDDSTANRATLRSNGGLANYQSNNVDLSDARTKTDISPLGSYWNKIAGLEIVTYKYKDQTHDDLNIGVIAQQVEQVAPEFVDSDGFGDTPEDGVPLKTIYNKDLTFAAIKALQEAMARIETLEAEVAALKGA